MKKLRTVILMFVVLLSVTPSTALAGGIIHGTAWLTTDDGTTFYADWLRILLVKEKIAVPLLPDLNAMDKFERMNTIRTAHMDFYIQARSKLAEDGFVIDTKMTTPEGAFFFDNVDPGAYFILVTFPAMIRTYKVAWQIPVTIRENETVAVELNNSNMVLPTYSR
mgnify:CR=1 FL=1|jgi:hypothetical protein